MRNIAVNLGPDLFGEVVNLIRGPITTDEGRQTEWLASLMEAKAEPPANISAVCLCRPVVEGQPEDLLVNVDEASICQPLLGQIAVRAYWAPKAIHSAQKLICPLHNGGIPWQGPVVTAKGLVYLDLFDIAVIWFTVPPDRQQSSCTPYPYEGTDL